MLGARCFVPLLWTTNADDMFALHVRWRIAGASTMKEISTGVLWADGEVADAGAEDHAPTVDRSSSKPREEARHFPVLNGGKSTLPRDGIAAGFRRSAWTLDAAEGFIPTT